MNAPAFIKEHPTNKTLKQTKSVKEYNHPKNKERLDYEGEDPLNNIESMANMGDSKLTIKGNAVNRGKSMTNLKPSQ